MYKANHETGDYMLTMYDIDYLYDYPYGVGITYFTIQGEINNCIGVVRSALKKAKGIV